MPGDRCARSLACENKKHDELVTTVTPDSPGIPRAMVLTVSFVLFPVTGLFCHRRLRDVAANLTPASGRQNHTTSPSASCAIRQRHQSVHRIPSRVRDDREPPLPKGRDRTAIFLLLRRRQELFRKIRKKCHGHVRRHGRFRGARNDANPPFRARAHGLSFRHSPRPSACFKRGACETCGMILRKSPNRGRPEVSGARSK